MAFLFVEDLQHIYLDFIQVNVTVLLTISLLLFYSLSDYSCNWIPFNYLQSNSWKMLRILRCNIAITNG